MLLSTAFPTPCPHATPLTIANKEHRISSKLTPTCAWRAWAGLHTPRDRPPVLGAANGPGRRPRSPLAPPRRAATTRNPRRRRAPPPHPPTPTTTLPSPSEGRGAGGEGCPP